MTIGQTARIEPRVSPKVAVGVVYVSAIFLSVLDTTIVNVALPAIGRAFSVPSTSVGSVSLWYLVSLAVFMPASGWLGDRFGSRRMLLAAVTLFTIASALCGIATSLGQLIAFRVLQGAGGGMLAPIGMAMLLRTFAPHERVKAASILTIPVSLAPTLGPVLGGAFVTGLSWRWVFYVNVPVGIAVVIFGLFHLPAFNDQTPGRFDAGGFLTAGLGLGLTMFGVSQGPGRGWSDPAVLVGLIGGAALLIAMIHLELHRDRPMMDIRLLKNRLFRACTLIMTLESVAFLAVLYVLALYLQDGHGLSALQAGLTILPEPIGVMLGSQAASRLLYVRLGPRRQLTIGLLGSAGAMALLAVPDAQTSLWWIRLLVFGLGLAIGQVFVGTQAASFATVPPSDSARASTLFNVGRRLGGAVGVAIATTTMVVVGGDVAGPQEMAPYRAAFLVAALICALTVPLALYINDTDAASTMPRRAV
jgi:EmrB/QacA subfamily drug resistance transporter